jgi:hypothetical protein
VLEYPLQTAHYSGVLAQFRARWDERLGEHTQTFGCERESVCVCVVGWEEVWRLQGESAWMYGCMGE